MAKTSYHAYSYNLALSNELSDRVFTSCSDSGCETVIGNDILKQQGVQVKEYLFDWPILIAMFIIYHTITLYFLYTIRFPPVGTVGKSLMPKWLSKAINRSNGKSNDEAAESNIKDGNAIDFNLEAEDIKPTASKIDISVGSEGNESTLQIFERFLNPLQVDIDIHRLSILVDDSHEKDSYISKCSSFRYDRKYILQDVHVKIKAGRLVAIMGGSGSGSALIRL